jgi:adenosylmethionine---8-amino-7-oxononanoate aminotransferase
MQTSDDLIERDLKHIWHPCAQMKDYAAFKPLEIVRAEGSYLELKDGRKVIDAISSWWCKSLGHQHPGIKAALLQQLDQFEHVMLAHTTNDTIVRLSEKLASLTATLNKVMYASDGSCAVEMAMKMSVHAHQLAGQKQKTKFVALKNAYHGETVGAMSVSDLGIYRAPYTSLLFHAQFITPPYVHGINDPLWANCEAHWQAVEAQLLAQHEQIAAIFVEPIVQAAAGMYLYSQDFLKRLRAFTKAYDIHLIADEIMTGIGRTGTMLASEHAHIEPDFLCLSKGLTAGCLPLSAVLTSQTIYDLFYDDYSQGKSFLHSHTHSGNALAASVALAVLHIMQEENLCERAVHIGASMRRKMQAIADERGHLCNIRGIGAIVAADIVCADTSRRIGFEVYQKAAELGALLRPIGRTLYWLPPLNIAESTLTELQEITARTLNACLSPPGR